MVGLSNFCVPQFQGWNLLPVGA
jgi:hypothetical protein